MSNNEIQNVYDDAQTRIEAAYKAFRAGYEVMKPPPQMAEVNRSFFGFKQVGMLLALIGSVIVSASHTVPVFLGISSITEINIASAEFVIAVAVFVMIEMAVVTFAYSATESEANVEAAHHVKRITRWGMWFIVTIMILGNVYYVLSSNVEIPTEGWLAGVWAFTRLTIFLLIGTSAPVVAFMTGDILAIDVIKHRAKSKRAELDYSQAYNEWLEGLQASWNAQKRRWGGNVDIQITTPRSVVHSPIHSLNGANEQAALSHSTGYSKQMNARDYIRQWFEENPMYLTSDDTVDVLHALIVEQTGQKVGRTSVYNVRKEMANKG